MCSFAAPAQQQQQQRPGMVERCKQALEQLQLADDKLRRQSERIRKLESELASARCAFPQCSSVSAR